MWTAIVLEAAAPAGAWPGVTRRATLAAAAAAFLAIVLTGWGAFTPGASASLTSGDGPVVLLGYLIETAIDGGVVALWVASAFGIGRLVLRGPGVAQVQRDHPLLRHVTAIALGIGVIGLVALLLGWTGWLNRMTAWAVIGAGIAGVPWRAMRSWRPWLASRSRGNAVAWMMAVPMGTMVLAASVLPGILWKPLDPHPYDVAAYHLQVPREWFEAGRVLPLPHNAFGYFPMGREIHDLLAMHLLGGAWSMMYVSQLMSATFAGLAALAVVGVVRALGGGAVIAWLAGLMAACLPWTLMLGSVAYVETAVMLYGTLAVAWAMLPISAGAGHGPPPPGRGETSGPASDATRLHRDRRASLLIAGGCAGLAGGVKYTALAMTAVPMFVLWPVLAWRGGRGAFRAWLIGVVACVLCVSPWLTRNLIWTGNPVFPLATSVFGRAHFSSDQADRYQRAHAPPAAERAVAARLRAAWDRVVIDPQFAYGFVPLTVLAMLRLSRTPAGRFGALVLASSTGVWLLATHDIPRFLALLIPLAAVMCGVASGRHRWARWAGGGAMASVAAVGVGWTLVTLGPTLDLGRRGLFRMPDFAAVLSPDVDAVLKSGQRLALVGDAQAYVYPFPAGRLKYRGVFDVVVPPGVSLADGWLGTPVEQLRAEGWWVLVSPAELRRLSDTYAHLPKPTPPFDAADGAPVLLPPTGIPK